MTASNAIEGVVVDRSRVPKLVSGSAQRFRNRSEAEFVGYSEALDYLRQNEALPKSMCCQSLVGC